MTHAYQSGVVPLRLHIEGDMTIYRAAELKRAIVTALDETAALELDLSAVSELDTAGIQLLMMTAKYARAVGHEFHLVAPGPAVMEVIGLLKLDTYFGDVLPAQPAGGISP